MAMGILFPIGFVLWFRIWRFRLRLWRDLQQTKKQCGYIMERLKIDN